MIRSKKLDGAVFFRLLLGFVGYGQFFSSTGIEAHAIVFVHIGKTLPPYIYDACSQARIFNKSCVIYLLANKEALHSGRQSILEHYHIVPVQLESLPRTNEHDNFLKKTVLPYNFRDGFWVYTSERFLYLYDFAQLYNIEDIIDFF